MTRKEAIKRALVAGLSLLALGGWCLHLRIHPPSEGGGHLVPFIFGILSTFFVPVLFCFRRTLVLAYLVNGFSVIFGTVLMAHFSTIRFKGPVTLPNILLMTTFPDIVLLWGKFVLGKALFDLELLRSETDAAPKGRFFRYPHMGWWWVHMAGVAAIYALGNLFWK